MSTDPLFISLTTYFLDLQLPSAGSYANCPICLLRYDHYFYYIQYISLLHFYKNMLIILYILFLLGIPYFLADIPCAWDTWADIVPPFPLVSFQCSISILDDLQHHHNQLHLAYFTTHVSLYVYLNLYMLF